MTDANERRSAGRATGLLWLVGGISGALWYLVPGADNFKLANTLYGHLGGDRVLSRVADVLRSVTRRGDLAARLGGDEFAVLVSAASEPQLRDLSERIVSAIRAADTGRTPPGCRLTASVGYALVDGDVDSLLDTADRRLRRAKGEGKDRWDTGSEVGVHVQAT